MRIAVMILAFNEEETIRMVLEQWAGRVAKILVLVSAQSWHGNIEQNDKTEEIAKVFGAEVIKMRWRSECEQRNWGLGHLYDYDYVLIVDADELYTLQDRYVILDAVKEGVEDTLGRKRKYDAYRTDEVKTYWKTTDYIFDPQDTHKPIVALNPKRVFFEDVRMVSTDIEQYPLPITLHHLSYCKSDEKVLEKIKTFEHYKQIKDGWYENVWQKWTQDMDDIRPYGREKSKAIYSPIPKLD